MLGGMPTGKRSSWRTAPLARVLGSLVAVALVATGLCRCGSEISAFPLSSASVADAGEDGDAPVVVIVSPLDGAASGDGAQGDAGEAGNVGCDPSQDPKDAPCLVDGVYGVFVSATTGQDTGIGTKLQPLKTITEGIAKAAQLGKSRVYVCNGSYAEQVSLDAQHDGIGLYGGFDCGRGWAWDGDAGATQVVGPSALYALRVDATTKAIAIEDMSFTVPDATGHDSTGAGNSSIAAFVSNESAGVNFQRVGLRAGAGAGGSGGGVPPTNLFSANAADLQGNGADGGAGGAAKDCHCKIVGDTIGGAGGAAGNPAGDGGAGTATPLPAQQLRNGAGGAGYNDTNLGCTVGRPGADGSPQGDGGIGATLGSLSASGWEPGSGTDGLPAYPGQGGGGGGGGQTGGGVGGGCGGCGGAGGLAGHGGGASVALLVFNATVALERVPSGERGGRRGRPRKRWRRWWQWWRWWRQRRLRWRRNRRQRGRWTGRRGRSGWRIARHSLERRQSRDGRRAHELHAGNARQWRCSRGWRRRRIGEHGPRSGRPCGHEGSRRDRAADSFAMRDGLCGPRCWSARTGAAMLRSRRCGRSAKSSFARDAPVQVEFGTQRLGGHSGAKHRRLRAGGAGALPVRERIQHRERL